MKTRYLPPLFFMLILFASLIPHKAQALAIPPADMFQLPWQLGESWISMDGFDNGTRREKTSPHNYNQGGAVDFAPHIGMKIGEDTSNAWVTAAAAGTVIEVSYCHVKIDHGNGWLTEYYHLGNIQVAKGVIVTRNQRLAIVDNNANGQICVGNRWPGPHLHFVLRPNMRNATLAGWTINYDQVSNITTFTKNGQTVGSFQPLLNEMPVDVPTATATATQPPTETPSATATDSPTATATLPPTDSPTATATLPPTDSPTPTFTPTGTVISPTATATLPPTEYPTATLTPTGTAVSPTPTMPSGLYVVTIADPISVFVGETSLISVFLYNLPPEGLTSAEFTCVYDPSLLEVSAIADAGLFGTDAVLALNGPQNGQFIFAIAGSNGKRATVGGAALIFQAKALQPGQSVVECKARVSTGSGALMDIPSTPANVTINQPLPVTGSVVGSVICCKPVTIYLYGVDNSLVTSTLANIADGSFNLTAPAGTYTIVADAEGFLSAQGTTTIVNGTTIMLSAVELPAGDIDGNGVIDPFDAMTIGMGYNTNTPSTADLNCDGIINVLDLEKLAANYRKSGALAWQ